MTPGAIVIVDWRDALPGSGEPNKLRPAIIVSSPRFFGSGLPFEIVVPLSGEEDLAIDGASLCIQPTAENGCRNPCYALAWNVQSVPLARMTKTRSRVTTEDLDALRSLVVSCVSPA